MLVRATARLSRASKFLQVFGQSSRQLTLSRPSMKMIQFMLSDIGEGTKEVVVKGKLIVLYKRHILLQVEKKSLKLIFWFNLKIN
jgi:hypothetical protein